MNIEVLYEALDLPKLSLLNKRIYKKMFHAHGQLTSADKKALSEDVDHILWKYTLKASTVQVRPYEDDEREYLEVAVIELGLSSRKRATRIAEIVHRAIPYPVLLLLVDAEGAQVSVAHKRFSLAEKGAIIADAFLDTPWISQPLKALDTAFLASLRLSKLSHADFYALYQDLYGRVLARNCAELTGKFELRAVSEEERRRGLSLCRELEREITSLRAAIHRDTSFADKVQLNTKIKALRTLLAKATTGL